ncbi:MAG TPA: nickel-dependent hydrogenase large subunit [Oligoflexus sp.]|uniref:Ni/Fe hydrogenase subunit alpha n=1 Tax=Oligoflexus sp. TaxID=1971216 RepID=UPI002D803848|nr:nickel-dependent hydrogenase large subunit [Oligoflexus sp.]HET9240118.1 nickel-dependent hydrogenase large subunit [Oligoflexus sp.]
MNPHDPEQAAEKTSTRVVKVGAMTRVEGEGSLLIQTEGDRVKNVDLHIFEPPRFFEAFLRGRAVHETPDITSRICGICPVAYQMSAVHAIESGLGVVMPDAIRRLRRLLYCGEWIESHVLHIYLLHAPDFLGLPDAISLGKTQRQRLETGLRLKKLGNRIMALLGGREIHPINVKVGGFYKIPPRESFRELSDELFWGIEAAKDTLSWVSGFTFPEFAMDTEYVALQNPGEYPMNEGNIASSRGLRIETRAFEDHFEEYQAPQSTALHARRRGHGSYLTGPIARFLLNFAALPPPVQKLAQESGIPLPCYNPYRSIQIRALEVIYACQEAQRLIQDYEDGQRSSVELQVHAGSGCAATEAPRGLLYHRYEWDGEGSILAARIVPPTSQNQSRMEEDLGTLVAGHLSLPDDELAAHCERFVRNFDPCISCATHFLKLTRERV